MMKRILLYSVLSLLSLPVLAVTREEVVHQYLLDLEKADYKHIATLFEPNGVVVSTSKGKMNAKEFFL